MSEIIINVKGKKSFKSVTAVCMACGYEEDRNVDMRSFETEDDAIQAELGSIPCPNCDVTNFRLGVSFPALGTIGADGSESSVAAMKKSFKERFIKKDLDSVKHRFGENVVHDSFRGGIVEKVKRGEG